MLDPDPILARLTTWALARPDVRAAWLTSTRARPGAVVDDLSDYDVVVAVDDVLAYQEARSWLADFGTVLAVYQDPLQDMLGWGFAQFGLVTQYADGLHIDFTIWSTAQLAHAVEHAVLPGDMDDGYRILYDPHGLMTGLPASTYTVFIPAPPSAAEFARTVEDFFSDVPYVAKQLWRQELLPARYCLDCDMKHVFLRRMLEWHAAAETGWAHPAGALGRGLKRRLRPDLWRALELTFVDARLDANWEALFATLALFRQAAQGIASRLGFAYPLAMDEQLVAYARELHERQRPAACDDEVVTTPGAT